MLLPEERNLSVLRWFGEAIPATARWYPVFQRYLEIIAGRVQAFGGKPGHILPLPTGNGVPGLPGFPSHPGGGTGGGGTPNTGHHEHSVTGKIDGIVFDHFGDFQAFFLETFEGERHRFESCEGRVLALVQRAWKHRILITIVVGHSHRKYPLEIILHGSPPGDD